MLQYVSKEKDDDRWYFSAYDQCWDDATLKELWEEHLTAMRKVEDVR